MKQFLIWLTLKEIRNQKELPVAVLDSKGQEVLIEGQSKYIQGIINGQVNISWFARPENSQLMLEQQENPINIANRKKLQEQEKAIQL